MTTFRHRLRWRGFMLSLWIDHQNDRFWPWLDEHPRLKKVLDNTGLILNAALALALAYVHLR